MKNLYTFKKNCWHARLFKWCYGVGPDTIYKAMCGYFWTMVITLFLLPLICLIKLLGNRGSKFLNNLESRKRRLYLKNKEEFITKCANKYLLNIEAYNIKTSKCWSEYATYLDDEPYNRIMTQWREHHAYLIEVQIKKEQNSVNYKETYSTFKESKIYNFVAYVVAGISIITLIFLIGYSIQYIYIHYSINWKTWKTIGIVVGGILSILGFSFIMAFHIIPYIKDYFRCKKAIVTSKSLIWKPFIFVGKGIFMIGEMLYLSYKKACPRTTWID